MRNRTCRIKICAGSSDGCEEGTELIRRRGRALPRNLQHTTTTGTQESTRSQRNSISGSELSELAIHTLLRKTRARDLDREVYQDPDSDRYLIPGERVFDNAADDLGTIAVSKLLISLLPKDGDSNSGGSSREPRVKSNDKQSRRRTYGSTRGRGSSAGYATGDDRTWGPNIGGSSTGNRQTSNERPTQGTHATGRGDFGNMSHAIPVRSHASQGRNNPSDSDRRELPNTEPLSRGDDTQAGHSREATSMTTSFEHLNRSMETFLTRLSKTNERSEKVFKKPRCYKDESDGCIDTWIEVMKLHFGEEDLSERQEGSALTSNLKGTALNCVMAKKQYQRDTASENFEI